MSIDSASGEVRLNVSPNFEAKSGYVFTVVATDAAGNASEKTVSLAINNLDEVAPLITSSATVNGINENSGANQRVYIVSSTDTADTASGATVYSLKVGSDAALMLDAATGLVRLKANPDFEAKSSYVFTVVATDTAGNASERTVTLDILDLNENSTLPSSVPTNPAPAVGAPAAEWDAWTQEHLGPDSVFAHQWDNIDPATIPGPISVSSPAYADAVALGNAAGAAYAAAVVANTSATRAANTAGVSPKSSTPIAGTPFQGLQAPATPGSLQPVDSGVSPNSSVAAIKSVASVASSISADAVSAAPDTSVVMAAASTASPSTVAPPNTTPPSPSADDALVLAMSKGEPAPASPTVLANAEMGNDDHGPGNQNWVMGRLKPVFPALVDLYTRISSRSSVSSHFQLPRPNADADAKAQTRAQAQAQSSDEYV